MRPMRFPKQYLLGPAAVGLAAACLAAVPTSTAHANPAGTGLVISEVYGAGGNSNAAYNADFVELYNPTDDPLPLAGLSIQYRSATGGAGAPPYQLSGAVPANSHYLIQMGVAGATGAALPTPDATASPAFSMAAAGGRVALVNGTTQFDQTGNVAGNPIFVDMVGELGAATWEGSGPAGFDASATQSLNRAAGGADTDNNAADFGLAAPTPTSSGAVVLPLEASAPSDVTAYVGLPMDEVELAASGGEAPYTWDVSGLPAGVTESEDGVISGAPASAGTYEVTATVTDSADPAATDEVTFTITVATEPETATIAEIQGTGASSPRSGETLTTSGVVTAAYPTGGFNGFYIQTPGEDVTPGASDGLFVFGPTFDESTLEVGDSVEVDGKVSEFSGLTELTALAVTELPESLGAVVPNAEIPGTDCALPGGDCPTVAQLDAAKEEFEGEVFRPTTAYTVTDVYDGSAYNGGGFSSGMFGEIGLAGNSSLPLVTPTEVEDAQTGDVAGRTAYNNAHRVILDDGSTLNYTSAANQDSPFPYFTADHAVRVGAAVTFDEPVVLDFRFGWKLQPQQQVVGEPEGITFEQTRAENALPAEVGGDIKLATFNVLNYFPTTGVEWQSMPGNPECDFFEDRDGNIITVDECGTDDNPGPRGAADEVNFERQEAKIVDAIVKLDADVISLEEIENSVKFGKDRDFAVATLVDALNEAEGAGTWAYASSPAADELPPVAEQDVIRLAAIYKPASVELVGQSRVLTGSPAFADAREPFAQAFKAVGGEDADAFAVIANHFKSKGSGVNDGTGQGNANPDRIAQAEALLDFAAEFQADRGITRVYLTGDFNAYSEEDPIQVLEAAGYTSLESDDDPTEETYNFDGMVGSLDHVLANEAAMADVTGVDVWEINGNESVYYEYSRFNYNATNLYAVDPFRSSDHNPELVGIDVPAPRGEVGLGVKVTPKKLKAKHKVTVHVDVTSVDGLPVTGDVTLSGAEVGELTAPVVDGEAQFRLPPFGEPGSYELTVTYGGSDELQPATTTVTVVVVR